MKVSARVLENPHKSCRQHWRTCKKLKQVLNMSGDREYSRLIIMQKMFIAEPNSIHNCYWSLRSSVRFEWWNYYVTLQPTRVKEIQCMQFFILLFGYTIERLKSSHGCPPYHLITLVLCYIRGVQYFVRILLLPKNKLFYFQGGKNE